MTIVDESASEWEPVNESPGLVLSLAEMHADDIPLPGFAANGELMGEGYAADVNRLFVQALDKDVGINARYRGYRTRFEVTDIVETGVWELEPHEILPLLEQYGSGYKVLRAFLDFCGLIRNLTAETADYHSNNLPADIQFPVKGWVGDASPLEKYREFSLGGFIVDCMPRASRNSSNKTLRALQVVANAGLQLFELKKNSKQQKALKKLFMVENNILYVLVGVHLAQHPEPVEENIKNTKNTKNKTVAAGFFLEYKECINREVVIKFAVQHSSEILAKCLTADVMNRQFWLPIARLVKYFDNKQTKEQEINAWTLQVGDKTLNWLEDWVLDCSDDVRIVPWAEFEHEIYLVDGCNWLENETEWRLR